MERRDYAKMINTTVEYLSREQGSNYTYDWQQGDILEVGKDVGLCWTDGGEFTIENDYEYSYVIKLTGKIKAHKVDYTNQQECYDLGCEGCEKEKEHLIPEGTKFRITSISTDDDFEEMGYYEVEAELIEEE